MNVLLTCAGRRNYLVRFFREALGTGGCIYAADANPHAPAMQEADEAFVVPPVTHPDYLPMLQQICAEYEVGLLVPLNDLELPLLAQHRHSFVSLGTILVISSPEVVDTCFDKWATCEYLQHLGIAAPRTYLSLEVVRDALSRSEITFPLIIKPRWGSASLCIEHVYDEEELELAYRLVEKRLFHNGLAEFSGNDGEHTILIQERLTGQEYGIDVVNDLNGKHVAVFVKRKLAMRAGETDQAEVVEHDELTILGRQIGSDLGHVGNLDCDVFVNSDGIFVLEMNPRFGGHYPFAHQAGANLPAALLGWARGEKPLPSWLKPRPGIVASKCDRLVQVNNARK